MKVTKTCRKATLPSGNVAVYKLRHEQLDPGYMDATVGPKRAPGADLNTVAILYGELMASKNGQQWYDNRASRASWVARITAPVVIAALEACQHT